MGTGPIESKAAAASASRSRLRSCLALAGLLLAWVAVMAASAFANPPSFGVPGMSEAELREAETKILGPAHAAEHAQLRAIAQEQDGQAIAASSAASSASTASAQTSVAGPPDQVGQWNAPFGIPTVGIHAVLLPTGKVMWWSLTAENTAQAWLWSPATGKTTRVDPPLNPDTGLRANIWCSGQMLLADGRVLVTGGNLAYPDPTPDFKGLNRVYTFNPYNESWTEQPSMPHGRWYPSQVLLPDGRALIISGVDEFGGGATNLDVELFTPSADRNGRGRLTTVATRGGSGQPPDGGLYPHMFVMPSGRTLVAGPNPEDSWFVNRASPFSWSQVPDVPVSAAGNRYLGSGVLAPGGPRGSGIATLIGGGNVLGGGSDATNTSVSFNEGSPSAWSAAPPLQIARTHHNTVLLPDGSMVTVGGGVGASGPLGLWTFNDEQRQIELFDPATQSWRLGPSQQEGRAYHSTALLLPDGRVLSAGDEYNGAGPDTAEIYEPPYLFRKGRRPKIRKAPKKTIWNDKFGIKSNSKKLKRAVLMAPGATTHANDMNQRYVELKVLKRIKGEGINVKAPRNANVAPPGYYMLFLINGRGEPSVARWVQLGTGKAKKTKLIGKG